MKERFSESQYKYYARITLIATIIINAFLIVFTYITKKDYLVVVLTVALINCVLMLLATFWLNQKKEAHNQKIEELAYKDIETNIYNLNYLLDNYKSIIHKIGFGKCSYITIDIDNFKFVNNVMGYETGNEILSIIAKVLVENSKPYEMVIRVGGDVFGMIMSDRNEEIVNNRIQDIFEKVKNSIINSYTERANINLSAGVTFIDNKDETAKHIIDKSNMARKSAKSSYNKNIVFYNAEMEEKIKTRLEIEEEMEGALKNHDFRVYLQPKVNMVTGKLYGAEALVRWDRKEKGILSPGAFLSVFEENGFIVKLDYYMFEEVCKIKRRWWDIGKDYPVISVNMSRLHIYDKNFVYNLLEIAKKYDVPPNELEIEVTENAFFEDSQMLLVFTDDLKRAGFKVSIDDFGSGFSSLNMLKDISADVLKIDRNFLISMDKNDGKGKKILKNVIAMARDLKIDIVTEGVENIEQIELLTDYGCEVAQGFYYARPMTVEDYEKFAAVHGEFVEVACLYRFDGDYKEVYDGEDATPVGSGFKFVDGMMENRKVLFLPGGDISENYIKIPSKYLAEESYSISIWMYTEEIFSSWSSLIYAEYETGFMSFMPIAWNGSMSYRILDNTYTEGWHDTHYPAIIKKNQWYNIVLTYSAKLEATRLYVNGEAVGYRGHVPPTRGIKSIFLGGDIYQQSMACYVADLVISDQVKSSSEIRDMYLEGLDRL